MADSDDFLDDVLDDFASTNVKPSEASTSAPVAPSSATQVSAAVDEEVDFDDEFARQLAAGMEQLMRDMSSAAATSSSTPAPSNSNAGASTTTKDLPDEAAFAKAMQDMMAALKIPGPSAEAPSFSSANPSPSTTSNITPSAAGSFQSQISQTLNKLRDSDERVEAQVADAAANDPAMEEMMKELERLMGGAGGAGGADFEALLQGVMEQVMTKDMMYAPMKDLADKYPEWLEANKEKVAPEDYERYKSQNEIVHQILAVYNSNLPTEEETRQVLDLMQKESGNPPEEIMKDLAPDMELGADGMPKLPPNIFAGADGAPDGDKCNIM